MTEFETNSFVVIKGFLGPETVDIISHYLENSLNRYPENNLGADKNSKLAWYADPLMEVVLKNSLPNVEVATGLALYPSYSFTRVYQKGDELIDLSKP